MKVLNFVSLGLQLVAGVNGIPGFWNACTVCHLPYKSLAQVSRAVIVPPEFSTKLLSPSSTDIVIESAE